MRTALAILILALVVLVADALSTEEEEAIQALLLSIPALNATSPPWTSNSSAACDKPSFYGLNCSNGEEPHVIGLYVDVFFIPSLNKKKKLLSCPASFMFRLKNLLTLFYAS